MTVASMGASEYLYLQFSLSFSFNLISCLFALAWAFRLFCKSRLNLRLIILSIIICFAHMSPPVREFISAGYFQTHFPCSRFPNARTGMLAHASFRTTIYLDPNIISGVSQNEKSDVKT